MKIRGKLLVAVLAMIAFVSFSSFSTQEPSGSKYVTLRIYEQAKGSVWDSKIVIAYENGKTEEMELGTLKPDNFVANAIKINETINTISAKGYTLLSVSGALNISTYTFVKK
ncbi:MAG: hypothetical protein IT247_05730 [Bacteroidia bacterium]|nr:hypothetical protein [Bacteroidia bacterium]